MSASMTLVIGTKRYSSWSLRPWLAARMANVDFDEILIALRQPETKAEILRHSPSGKVPCLIHGEVTVWDSLAICEYLAELHPTLWPEGREARAVARAVSAEMHSGFPNLRNTCSMDICALTPLAEVPPEVQTEIDRIQALWNDCRARFGAKAGGPFLFGRFSVADAMYAPVVSRFTTFAIAMDPVSRAYCEAIWSLAPMQDWKQAAED
ncbi:glutathione S-transferase family protein [Magnetospirillum aberrantis]|uniref:Glutathione S-transferase family protein n=1 Tax=Magnetospirillum aberrantis SpK TaxID=908842 RepID=A0A7C9UWM2_9PROT|nr:glutathione S-transferase family protein [Magnetospirillum aberrantis]NFV82248.1 glutathione S-transferase family protein [Magnetospirillum aberrantis SpK]